MPLRIDTGRLSDLARQRGQFQADASARAWQTLGALGEGTMGAYQGEMDRQADEARAKSQDEYYDVMRRQNEAQLKSDERKRKDENRAYELASEHGDDYSALSQAVIDGDETAGTAALVEAGIAQNIKNANDAAEASVEKSLRAESAMIGVSSELDTIIKNGSGEAYIDSQPGWVAKAIEFGATEAQAMLWFPRVFNIDRAIETADLLRGQANRLARSQRAIEASNRFTTGDLESIPDQQKLVMYSLSIDEDMNQEKLDEYFRAAPGDIPPTHSQRMRDMSEMGVIGAAESWEDFKPRSVSDEVLASFDDLRTFDAGWPERFEAHRDRIFTEDEKTWDEAWMAAHNAGNYPELARLYAARRARAAAGRVPGSDESEPELAAARIAPLDTGPLVEELDALVNMRPGSRGWTYGQEPLEGEALADALDVAENAFRTKHGLMPKEVEDDLMADIQSFIRSQPDFGLSDFDGITWPGKENWEAQIESDMARGDRGARREASVGAPNSETIPIPEATIREWTMEFFRSKKAEDLFPTASAYDVRRTLHAFPLNWRD